MGCISSKDSAADTDHSLPTRTPAQKGNSSAAGPTERLSSTQLSNRGKANGQCHETNSRPAGEKGVDEERVLDQLRLERLLVADRNGKHSHSFSGPTGYAIQHAVLPSKEKEEAGFVSLAAVQVGLPVEGKPETGGVDKPISLADRDLSIQQHLGRRRSSWAALTGPADRSPVASGRSPRKSAGLPIPEDMQDLHGATDIGIGGRGDNQDSYATSVFRDDRGVETALAAVFDGHGPEGSRCSNLCASKLKETFDEQRDLEVQSAFFAPSTKSVMSGSFTRTVWNQGAQSATSFGSSCSNRGELLKQEFLDREERLLHLLFYSLEERLKEVRAPSHRHALLASAPVPLPLPHLGAARGPAKVQGDLLRPFFLGALFQLCRRVFCWHSPLGPFSSIASGQTSSTVRGEYCHIVPPSKSQSRTFASLLNPLGEAQVQALLPPFPQIPVSCPPLVCARFCSQACQCPPPPSPPLLHPSVPLG
uniref:Uncharacterized protein n=1 Tax=Tetraselmis sp. GSL018 TaxID=582737 RepID=A0A061R800_9CHLO